MNRREFITLLGGAAAWPMTARAQQPAMPLVGILAVTSPEANATRMRAFREALRAAGYVDGQNVQIKYRWAEANTGRLPELAAQLAQDHFSSAGIPSLHQSPGEKLSRSRFTVGTSPPIFRPGLGAIPVPIAVSTGDETLNHFRPIS